MYINSIFKEPNPFSQYKVPLLKVCLKEYWVKMSKHLFTVQIPKSKIPSQSKIPKLHTLIGLHFISSF